MQFEVVSAWREVQRLTHRLLFVTYRNATDKRIGDLSLSWHVRAIDPHQAFYGCNP